MHLWQCRKIKDRIRENKIPFQPYNSRCPSDSQSLWLLTRNCIWNSVYIDWQKKQLILFHPTSPDDDEVSLPVLSICEANLTKAKALVLKIYYTEKVYVMKRKTTIFYVIQNHFQAWGELNFWKSERHDIVFGHCISPSALCTATIMPLPILDCVNDYINAK